MQLTSDKKTSPVTPAFTAAMDGLAKASPDRGEHRPDWYQEHVHQRLCSVLEAGQKIAKDPLLVLAIAAGAITVFFKPSFSEQALAQKGALYDAAIQLGKIVESSFPWGKKLLLQIQSICDESTMFGGNQLRGWDKPPMVNLGLTMAYWAQTYFIGYGIINRTYAFMRGIKEKEQKLAGTQPVDRGSEPSVVILGPGKTSTTILDSLFAGREIARDKPAVIIHKEDSAPQFFSAHPDTSYHWRFKSSSELVTNAALEETGIAKAKNLVYVGCDEDKALFYGLKGCMHLGPSAFATILAMLSQREATESLPDKVAVILPAGLHLLGGEACIDNLFTGETGLSAKGVALHVIHPEQVLIDKLKERIEAIRQSNNSHEIKLCLLGGKDQAMLDFFKRYTEEHIAGVTIQIVSESMIGNKKTDELSKLDSEARNKLADDIMHWSDINIIYGDHDEDVPQLANIAIKHSGEDKQTLCIIESPEFKQVACAHRLDHICVYEEVATKVAEVLGKQGKEILSTSAKVDDLYQKSYLSLTNFAYSFRPF